MMRLIVFERAAGVLFSHVCISSVGFLRSPLFRTTRPCRRKSSFGQQSDGGCIPFSRVHAKGVVVEGTFKLTRGGPAQPRNAIQRNPIPVTARFSDGSGMPPVPYGSPAIAPGIAQVHLAGGVTPHVTNSFQFFPVGTGDELSCAAAGDHLRSPPDAPPPEQVDRFSAAIECAEGDRFAPSRTALPTRNTTAFDAFIFGSKSGKGRQWRVYRARKSGAH